MDKIKETKKTVWGAALLAVAVFAVWKIHENQAQKSSETNYETTPVAHVAPIVEQNVTVEKKYIGFVKPINDVVLRPYISGFIGKVAVKGGQKVNTGDKLVEIDASIYQAALEAAEAAVAKSEVDYAYAKDYFERVEKAGLKAFSTNEINNARTQYLAADASLKQARAAARQAEVNLGYTNIVAPIDGVVGNVPLTVGDYVSPQSELMTIVQTDPIRVVFSISDKDYLEEIKMPSMFAGEKVKLKLADGSIYNINGEFKYIDNKLDRSTDSIAVYFDFDNPQGKLVDNAYVTALVEKHYQGIICPKDLVNLQSDGSFVYVAEGDIVKKHPVRILSEYQNSYILQNDFAAGEKLVTDKITLRSPAQKMTVVENRAGGTY